METKMNIEEKIDTLLKYNYLTADNRPAIIEEVKSLIKEAIVEHDEKILELFGKDLKLKQILTKLEEEL